MNLKSHRITVGVLALVAGLLVSATWAGWPHHRTHPTLMRGIPNRDYDYPQYSQPQLTLSRPAVPLAPVPTPADSAANTATGTTPTPTPAAKLPQRKLFQLDTPRVRIDHCEVSRFSLVIDENGNWLLNASAEQGVTEEPAVGDVTAERELAVLPQRNEFRLCVRGYPATSAVGDPELEALGRPVLFELPVQTIWVQKSKTRFVRVAGQSMEAKRYFPLIDRVELEFSYR
jgi:hypothetical protein